MPIGLVHADPLGRVEEVAAEALLGESAEWVTVIFGQRSTFGGKPSLLLALDFCGMSLVVDKVVEVILEQASTGKIGDGKVFVLPIEAAYRIRTKEQGKDAI